MKKYFSLLFIWQAAFLNAFPQTDTLTLPECIHYALEHNFSIRLSKLDEKIDEEHSREIASAGLPQISGNGSFDDNIKIPVSAIPARFFNPSAPTGEYTTVRFSTQYNAFGNLQLDQLIYQGSYWVGLRASKVSRRYYELATEEDVINTIYEVSRDYYQALILKRQIEIQEANINAIRELLRIVTLQYEQDVATKADRDRIQVNYNNQLAELRRLRRSMEIAINQLQFAMGMPLEQDIALVDVTEEKNSMYVGVDTSNASFHQNRIEFNLFKTLLELRKLDIKQYRAGYQPVLSGYGRFQYQAYRQEFNFFDFNKPWYNSQVVGLRLTVPIFDGFRKRAQIRQARSNLCKTELEIERLQQSINLEVSNALGNYLTALESVRLEKENMELAQEIYKNASLLFEQGLGSYADYIDAENALRVAQLNYTNSLLNVYLAKTDLAKSQGKIKELITEGM